VIVQSIFARLRFAFAIAAGWLLCAGFSAGLSAELSAELSTEESGTPPGASSTVTRQEVWQAVAAELRRRGLAEQQLPRVEDIDLPMALPALVGRKLRVSSECWDAVPQRTQFRLECGAPGECLPFLVYLHGDVHGDVHADLRGDVHDAQDANAGAHAGSCRLATGSHLGLRSRSVPEASPKPTVRAGERARAVLLSNGFRMTASVTCLDRGGAGEIIRVRALDGHVFRARISGPALLEALPQ
jgi:hypothetical protein